MIHQSQERAVIIAIGGGFMAGWSASEIGLMAGLLLLAAAGTAGIYLLPDVEELVIRWRAAQAAEGDL